MKTAKKLTAILLCIAMLLGLGATSAFALEIGDTVTWTFFGQPDNDYTAEIPYKGTLNEGHNEIEEPNGDYNTCYTFEATKDGYYMVTFPAYELSVLFADTFSGDKAKNYADHIYTGFTDEYGIRYHSRVAYLTKGTSLLNVEFDEFNPAASGITIEYYAESITDVSYDEETVEYLFKDNDCYINEDNKTISINVEYSISFSNGKMLNGDDLDNWFGCAYEDELVTGENTVTMLLPGYEKEIVIGLYETSDFVESVESVEIPNAENYLDATELYNKQYLYTAFDNEEVTVNFKDGTKETVIYVRGEDNYVTFPCGKEIYIYVGHTVDERANIGTGKLCLYVRFGDTYYYLNECNTEKASFSENFDELQSNIMNRVNTLIGHYEWYMENIINGGDFAYWMGRCFDDTGLYLELIGNEISEFFNYYF